MIHIAPLQSCVTLEKSKANVTIKINL